MSKIKLQKPKSDKKIIRKGGVKTIQPVVFPLLDGQIPK